jgi:hypothetical protein
LAGNMLNIEGPLGKKSIDIDLEMFNPWYQRWKRNIN